MQQCIQNRVQSLSSHRIAVSRPPLLMSGNIRHSSQVFEIEPFLNSLCHDDLQAFWKHATSSFEHKQDERTITFKLRAPITIAGRIIRALRLKGISPVVSGNNVKRYSKGKGFNDRTIYCNKGDEIRLTITKPEDYPAEGTMTLERLEREIVAAIKMGSDITDTILGFGSFENISYMGKPVGFAIYGMEREEDIRVGELLNRAKSSEALTEYYPAITESARLLRETHDKKIAHGSLHPYNIAFDGKDHLRLVDLDLSFDFSNRPAIDHPGIIYADLLRPIHDYYQYSVYKDKCVFRHSLLTRFLLKYFKENRLSYYVKLLEIHLDTKYEEKGYQFDDFDNLSPIFRPNAAINSVEGPLLTRPMVDLFMLPQGKSIYLNNYRSPTEIFDYFMEAIGFSHRGIER